MSEGDYHLHQLKKREPISDSETNYTVFVLQGRLDIRGLTIGWEKYVIIEMFQLIDQHGDFFTAKVN